MSRARAVRLESPSEGKPQAVLAGRWTYPALLAIFMLVVFWKILFTSQYSMLTWPDASWQTYPWVQHAVASVRSGNFPFWDPYTDGGRTFAGEIQTGTFYPPQWLLALLPLNARGLLPVSDIESFILLHFLLASLLMYQVARDLGLGRLAAFVSGVSFAYSGSMLGRAVAQPNIFCGAAWIPGMFLCWLRALRARSAPLRLLYLNLSGLCLALTLLAGHHQPFLYAALAIPVMGAGLRGHSKFPGAASARKVGAAALLVFVFALVYASAQLLPSVEYAGLAYRWLGGADPASAATRVPYELTGGDGLFAPEGILSFIFPSPPTSETSPYMGILPLFLAVAGVAGFSRNRTIRAACLVALFFFALSLGSYLPLHGLLYLVVPGFDKARLASRSFVIVHFALSLLAGYGCQRLFARRSGRRDDSALSLAKGFVMTALSLAALVAAAFFYRVQVRYEATNYGGLFFIVLMLLASSACVLWRVAQPRYRTTAAAVALAVMLCDFHFAAMPSLRPRQQFDGIGHFEPQQYYRRDPVIDFLRSHDGVFRVDFREEKYPRNVGQVHRLETVHGYSASRLQRFHDFVSADYSAGSRIADLLNVRFVVSSEALSLTRVFEWQGVKVYENADLLPRVWRVQGVTPSRGFEETLSLLRGETFDPRESVIIEPDFLDAVAASGRQAEAGARRMAEPEFTRTGPNSFTVSSPAAGPGWIVISQNWYPGWRATVNGAERPVIRVDGALMAVGVEGPSRIDFAYRPRWWAWSLALALAAAFSLVVTAVLARRSGSRAGATAEPGP